MKIERREERERKNDIFDAYRFDERLLANKSADEQS